MTSVIVVDDDGDVAEVLGEFLTIKGINVLGRGSSSPDAVNLYIENKPDIVLIDVTIPNHDWFAGIKKIMQIDPDAKIIVVTVDTSPQTKKKLKELDVSVVIYKPYDVDALLGVINTEPKGQMRILTGPTN